MSTAILTQCSRFNPIFGEGSGGAGRGLPLHSRCVDGVRVRDNEAGSKEVVGCNGVFVFVGLKPNASLLPADVARDERGFVVTDANFETSSPGVFAVGAVRSGYGGRLTQAVAEATTAAERAAAGCDD